MSQNYYRFWLLNHQGQYIFDKKLTKIAILPKSEEDNLVAEIFRNPKIQINDDTPVFTRELTSSFTRLHYKKYRKDLYVFLVDELVDIIEVENKFQKWIQIRNQQREHLKGLVISVFDDLEGPKVFYNDGFLEFENALILAVQGQTVSSMGRSAEHSLGLKDPLNVPNCENLFHLSYNCLQPAPDSTDHRIVKMGRMTTFHLIFTTDFPYANEDLFRVYLEGFLDEWVYNWNVQKESKTGDTQSNKIFDELLEDLRSTILMAIDLTTHEEREVAKLKEYVMNLMTQNKVLNYQVRRLKEKIKNFEEQLGSK
ncbi:MAG: hypothetical protein ACXAC8_19905 [Candidatus Hodarchaeales archaeon]|jgi:hypothetical protein